jgi:hypothetical protein
LTKTIARLSHNIAKEAITGVAKAARLSEIFRNFYWDVAKRGLDGKAAHVSDKDLRKAVENSLITALVELNFNSWSGDEKQVLFDGLAGIKREGLGDSLVRLLQENSAATEQRHKEARDRVKRAEAILISAGFDQGEHGEWKKSDTTDGLGLHHLLILSQCGYESQPNGDWIDPKAIGAGYAAGAGSGAEVSDSAAAPDASHLGGGAGGGAGVGVGSSDSDIEWATIFGDPSDDSAAPDKQMVVGPEGIVSLSANPIVFFYRTAEEQAPNKEQDSRFKLM